MRDDYLLTEPPFKAILLFSLPMMLGNFFQQFYTMADSVIVGRFVGENALAAVGASYALTTVFISIAIGGGAGASVITGQAFGRGNGQEVKESISVSLISFLVISIILAIIGYTFSPLILRALNTPLNIEKDADIYLRIYFLGLPFLFMYNILSSIFNALGKSRIPLFLLIFSSLLNIILDIVAVTVLEMGVAGAAWATLISQAISAMLSFCILLRKMRKIEGRIERYFSFGILSEMSGIALPSILQQSVISFGMMLVQSVVNTFGSEVLAGYSAAIRVDSLSTVSIGAIGNALCSYTAQNVGAGKERRIIRGYHMSFILVLIFSAITCAILIGFKSGIIALFLGEDGTESAYLTGEHYISYLGWFYAILGAALITGGLLRGAGDMKLFTIASIGNLTLRVAGAFLLAPHFGVEVVWYIVPLGWSIYFIICYLSYRSGKWRKALASC